MRAFAMWAVAVTLLPGMWGVAPPSEIDTQKSVMTVRVFKTGLFSAFAHDHEISAPIRDGKFSETARSVDLTVDARQMRVLDKEVSEKDRSEIQLKQRDFGIEPISIGGGAVKVKNELRVEFDIVAKR